MMSTIGQIGMSELPIWELAVRFDLSTPAEVINEF